MASTTKPDTLPLCPLCQERSLHPFFTQRKKIPWRLYSPGCERAHVLQFFQCSSCHLIVKDPMIRATQEQQRAHYAKHNNDISDPGYREHLLRLINPLQSLLPDGAAGLDYGCGPTQSMEALIKERGISCLSYDPFFFPDAKALTPDTYHFITCSEVVEHFQEPHSEFPKLLSLLKPGGLLAIMTQFPPPAFEDWWYHRDPTHVCFYSESTFTWISNRWSLTTVYTAKNVVILKRA